MVVCLVIPGFVATLLASEDDAPQKRWRIIYVEGGPDWEFQSKLAATARHLGELKLIDNGEVPLPANSYDTSGMWAWLAKNAGSGQIEFLRDGWYGAGHDAVRREEVRRKVLRRIQEKNDVDIILAFGSEAAIALATDEHTVPTLAVGLTDPVGAGISALIDDSGRDHVHVQVDPAHYRRQLKLFHDVFKFGKLGVPCVDSAEGRAFVGLPEIRRMSVELGFELRLCETPSVAEDAVAALKSCLEKLCAESDAIYLTYNPGVLPERMAEILEPIIRAGLPSFSQSGAEETKLGVLMSLSEENFQSAGRLAAETIMMVINGVKPRDVPQVFTGSLGLALNLRMAMLIGWRPPLEVLAAVDSLYSK